VSTSYKIKLVFDKLLKPIAALLVKTQTTKDQLSILALFFSILYGLLLFMYPDQKLLWVCLPLFFVLQTTITSLSQILGDEFKIQSRFDPFLHELGSALSDSSVYLPFIFLATDAYLAGIIFLLLSMMTEMTRLLANKSVNSQNNYGLLGKGNRAILFSVVGVAFGFNYHPELYFAEFFSLLCIWSIATILLRIKAALSVQHP
jgi:CDP-diacylglycerol--glycerol-3-phosphate 3-phosphatidyltransferase